MRRGSCRLTRDTAEYLFLFGFLFFFYNLLYVWWELGGGPYHHCNHADLIGVLFAWLGDGPLPVWTTDCGWGDSVGCG